MVSHAYKDSRGYLTIGVGHLIDEELGGGLSEDEIDYLLANNLKVAEQGQKPTRGLLAFQSPVRRL